MIKDPRAHLTEGINRARLESEARRSIRSIPLLLFGLVLAVFILRYFVTHISQTLGRSTYTVRFAVPDDFGVFAGFDDVRFRGVRAGTITAVEHRGPRLILVTTIRTGSGIVYRDARAQIRPITPLNNMYLDIVDPGTKAAGRADPNQPLDESQTETSVTVPDVLDVFQGDVRTNAARLLDQLGNGAADGGLKLRQAFVELGPFLRSAGDLTRQLAIRSRVTSRLIHNSATLTAELAEREGLLRRLVDTGAASLGALNRSSGDLDATLQQLGPTFVELKRSLAAVRGVVGDVDTGLGSLNPVADRLPGALASLRSLNSVLAPAVTRLRPSVRGLTPWVGQLHRAAQLLEPTGAALRPQTLVLDRLTKDLVSCEQGVIGFFQWDTSLLKFGDANGPIPRGNLAFGLAAAGLPGEPLRDPETACTPGPVVRGVPTAKDFH